MEGIPVFRLISTSFFIFGKNLAIALVGCSSTSGCHCAWTVTITNNFVKLILHAKCHAGITADANICKGKCFCVYYMMSIFAVREISSTFVYYVWQQMLDITLIHRRTNSQANCMLHDSQTALFTIQPLHTTMNYPPLSGSPTHWTPSNAD